MNKRILLVEDNASDEKLTLKLEVLRRIRADARTQLLPT